MTKMTRPDLCRVLIILYYCFSSLVHGGDDQSQADNNSNHIHPQLNRTFIEELDKACPNYCADQPQYNSICINQGCKEWRTGLRDGCGAVCNGSKGNYREFHACQQGCSKVIDVYYFHITGILGSGPDPPTLISGSLNNTSLRLSWDGSSEALPYLVFTIQKRLYLRNHPWETVPTEPLNQTTSLVQNLKPFTEYQFRIGWVLAHDFPPFYSMESYPIATLAKGLPNAPEITSIQSISNTSVSITWLPPSEPNGPLVAYILKLHQIPDGHYIIKEITMAQNQRGYTFSGLLPNTNYSLAISVHNLEGEGDGAIINFITPKSSISNDISKRPEPRLLLQGVRDVYIQQINLLLEPDVSVYVSNQNVTGMSAHFKRKLVFIATAEGQVLRVNLDKNQTSVILPKEKLDIFVTFLSVDWLHDRLYLVGKKKRSSTWCIKKCELNGERLTTVLPTLGAQPIDFMADPYTGYLYWVSPQPYNPGRDALYKMDLIGEDGPSTYNTPVIPVLEEAGLGPFTIDFPNYRILIVHKVLNTVLSVALDGETTDIRPKTQTQSPQFGDVLSIGTYGGIFYWTTGQTVGIEEYNEADDSFYHNIYAVPKPHQPCSRLLILHPDLQPIPSPMAPPMIPQGVFSQRRARIIWRPPPQIAGLGDGAWRAWKYQIRLSDNTSISNITETEYVLTNLKPSAFYSIQVLAYSPSGRGPLSQPFRGRTLRETGYNISFLWGSDSGLYASDPLGENVDHLVFPTQWKNAGENWSISSLTWHESSVFFSINNGSVYHYDGGRGLNNASPVAAGVKHLRGISFAHSIAFDYMGEKLYWSNPKKQALLRCSFKDIDAGNMKIASEWLPVMTTAHEIAIDSYKALLIWTTGHSLEMSRLNGYHHSVLYSVGLFTGVRVVGITLDTEQSRLYWISRSSTGSTLYRLSYNAKNPQVPAIITNLDDVSITGPIRYFSDRLMWLQGSSDAVITDLDGQGKSILGVHTISNISQVLVRDPSWQRYPPGLSRGKLNVTPSQVPSWSISVSGKWNDFTVTWQPLNNTNYGRIFYEVSVNDYNAKPTSQHAITIENGTLFKPYTEVDISITAITDWVSSNPTVVKRQTPSAKPSEPLNPRIFLDQLSYPYSREPGFIKGELRWDSPVESNGVILGYLVHCWKDSVKASDCFLEVDLNRLSCAARNLSRNSTYEFAIQAYTDAGAGKLSRRVGADTNFVNPISRLLLASGEKLQVLDIDRNQLQSITSPYNPITATYSASDETIYWFDEGQDLRMSNLDGSNKTHILSLNGGEASHLVIDWISRKLYWISESTRANINPDEKYSIISLDLSLDQITSPETVHTSRSIIKSIAVNPYKNSILWTTSRRNGIMAIYTAQADGSSVETFLSRDSTRCNCTAILSVGEAIAFDPAGFEGYPRGILLSEHQSIWLADENGCECRQVVNISGFTTTVPRLMSPPYRLTGDKHHIYWTSMQPHNTHSLYASEKPGNGITELSNGNGPLVREVSVIGPSAQPFPGLICLIPQKLEVAEPILFNHSSHSLHLQLPKPIMPDCSLPKISSPTPKYRVYYGTVDENGITECTPSSLSHCKMVKSTKSLLRIDSLHPYTTYTVFVMVTNYYAEKEGTPALVCSPIMLRTAPGAPMPPKLLRLEPLTPISVRVVWGQPEKLNGEKVWYEVKWQTGGSHASPKHKDRTWAETESKSNHNHTEYSLDITNLQSSSNYSIWVVAFSEKGDAFSESDVQVVETFPNPNNLTVINSTPHLLSLSWVPPKDTSILRHQIMYRAGWSSEWNSTELVNFTIPGRRYNLTVIGLKPKTLYGFRLKTWYKGSPLTAYLWPKEGQFDLETLADKPSKPGIPIARGIGKALYEVTWERAEENGAVVDTYSLECLIKYAPETENLTIVTLEDTQNQHRQKRSNDKVEIAEKFVSAESAVLGSKRKGSFAHWSMVYNGSESRWQVRGLDLRAQYIFRVRAKNYYGWGQYSEESTLVSLGDLTVVAESQSVGLIFGIIFLGIFILGTFALLFIYVYRRKLKEKPALQSPTASERREVELATLRELPAGSSFIHQSNILYAADLGLEFDFDGVPIPKVKKHHISLITLLGSGAFGEVYEGYASNIHGGQEEEPGFGTRVAIKTLRKGATGKDKIEFIEEARIMAQFRHPHILQLLGICIDADPCLILELMSGGDLLSHLRSNRTPGLSDNLSSSLSLTDLLGMCLDVAKGCVYLEELHFVHRDLAARNCLVRLLHQQGSSGIGEVVHRVVKIGDFGLARDIYRNDYYRKDGEGLVPVRWMAPESLIDGVFTTQSDVWAFGVLLWEIMTLGHQPYPARNNSEVLNYVRSGGRLHPPPHCPERLSHLMLQCWEYGHENRPTFKECLSELETLSGMYDIPSHARRNALYENQTDHPGQHNLTESAETRSTLPLPLSPEPENDSVYIPRADLSPEDHFRDSPDPDSPTLYFGEQGAVGGSGFPKYLEVIGDSSSPGLQPAQHFFPVSAQGFLDDGYEIPLPQKPPRNPRGFPPSRFSISSGDETTVGLPSPPPYWNTPSRTRHEVDYPRRPSPNYHHPHPPPPPEPAQYFKVPSAYAPVRKAALGCSESSETDSHFRNLLASSASEDLEELQPEDLLEDLEPPPFHLENSSSSSNEMDIFYESPHSRRNLATNYFGFQRAHQADPGYNSNSSNIFMSDSPAPTMTLSKVLPSSPSSSDSEYSRRQRQYYQYHNSNRPCVKAANSG